MIEGIYEQLISRMVQERLQSDEVDQYVIRTKIIDEEEAVSVLSRYIMSIVKLALGLIKGKDKIQQQIDLSNKIIMLLRDELSNIDFDRDLIEEEGKLLQGVFKKLDSGIIDFDRHLKEITPYTRLSQSELFTGSNVGISMESEIKKEIASADRVCFLVSFIKWTGIRIFEKELRDLTSRGGELKVITTSYMGATDAKAVEFLSSLPATQVKVSYNTKSERLHAKAYLFQRNTGYHTGYIGSSNISKSALTKGLEWNIKVTTQEVGHLIDKFQKTFDTYWQDAEFETYRNGIDKARLVKALKSEKMSDRLTVASYFDVKPYTFQKEILDKLTSERAIHGRTRNLIVAATGTGKTIISAFDYKQFRDQQPNARLLFVAHRKEILQQALTSYRGILRDNNFGDLWVGGLVPDSYSHVFASVQTLNNQISDLDLSADYYDFIVIDEVHHIAASSYRPILDKFDPKVLIGLTATPERQDQANILEDFDGRIAAEIRLPEALNRKLLCPFQYFGITDSVDLSNVSWRNGKYEVKELTKVYTANDLRVRDILRHLDKYITDYTKVKALGFCVSIDHARFMAEKFVLAGLKADYLVSRNLTKAERDLKRVRLISGEINYLFVVDIFNEGVDIPEIDTVLFLRPTESLTVFLQQLGRGLRLSEGKECLTVLDFVGNSRPEYDYESKFRALVGKTNTSVIKEVEDDFPHLPLGCSIVLERKAKDYIVENIKNATNLSAKRLVMLLQNYQYQTDLRLTLVNFVNLYSIPLPIIYKRGGWSLLKYQAGLIDPYDQTNEKKITSGILKKWLSSCSYIYFKFVNELAKNNFQFDEESASGNERNMVMMLHHDIWQSAGDFKSLQESLKAIGSSDVLTREIIEVTDYFIDNINYQEQNISLPYHQPLMVHSRYTRSQILAAFGESTLDRVSSAREGVLNMKSKKTELLFVTLEKSEENYSPTTLYDDYAISSNIFHWQSQNTTKPDSGKGQEYINHKQLGKNILLFVRERNTDEYKNTMGFVFLGKVNYRSHYGSKPMSIEWDLEIPIPSFLWKASGKMAVG